MRGLEWTERYWRRHCMTSGADVSMPAFELYIYRGGYSVSTSPSIDQSINQSINQFICIRSHKNIIKPYHKRQENNNNNNNKHPQSLEKLAICLPHSRTTYCQRSVGQFSHFQPALLRALIFCAHSIYATWWCTRNQVTIFSLLWRLLSIWSCQDAAL